MSLRKLFFSFTKISKSVHDFSFQNDLTSKSVHVYEGRFYVLERKCCESHYLGQDFLNEQ